MTGNNAPTDKELAAQMSRYLFESPGYNRDAPVMEIVKSQISGIARELAQEMVWSNTELVGILKERMEQTLQLALKEESWLQRTVIDSVAKALHNAALGINSND